MFLAAFTSAWQAKPQAVHRKTAWLSRESRSTGQVPYVPGVAAVVPQHRFLGGGGVQPVPGHANTLANTADISGEVTRRFLPGLKAGVSTPRSR